MSTAKRKVWGYIDREGVMVIEPQFDDAWDFHEGLAVIKIDWARGYIDRSGRIVIEPQFQKAEDFWDGVAHVMLDDEWFYIDREGKRVETPDNEEALNSQREEEVEWPKPVLAEGKFGYANEEGEMVIASKYCEAEPFHERLARVKTTPTGKWGYIRPDGKTAFPSKFEGAKDFHDTLAAVLLRR